MPDKPKNIREGVYEATHKASGERWIVRLIPSEGGHVVEKFGYRPTFPLTDFTDLSRLYTHAEVSELLEAEKIIDLYSHGAGISNPRIEKAAALLKQFEEERSG